MSEADHYQTGADSCACGNIWPCGFRSRGPRRPGEIDAAARGVLGNAALEIVDALCDGNAPKSRADLCEQLRAIIRVLAQ